MLKKHIVLFETKEYDWVAYSTTGSDARRMVNITKNGNIFYIFECDITKQYPYTMKLKAPLNKYYDCKNIIKYKEQMFEENDESIIVSYEIQDRNFFDIKYIKT